MLLEVRNLCVEFQTTRGPFRAIEHVDLDVEQGEILGIVGESGSGKSVTMLAVMGLLPWSAKVSADRLQFAGQDLLRLKPRARRRIVGAAMAMIFQEPMTSLNPSFTVGFQIMEALAVHVGGNRRQRRDRAVELLTQVGIPAPAQRIKAYPHQLSGGMSQRVMIAMAIACNPRLLIADEPTTALDVTIQAQILALLAQLQREHGMALLFIAYERLITGIDMPQLPVDTLRAQVRASLASAQGLAPVLVFGCDHGAGVQHLAANDVAVHSLLCVGQLPPSLVEYALHEGAAGVLVASCPEGGCEFRLGPRWTLHRFAGLRRPHLRSRMPRERLQLVGAAAGDEAALSGMLQRLRTRLNEFSEPTEEHPS